MDSEAALLAELERSQPAEIILPMARRPAWHALLKGICFRF